MKIKRILVSQPKPEVENSPFAILAEKNNLKIDYRPFIKIEPVSAKEFRKSKVSILAHTAVIFTSKTAVDHYFRMSEEMRLTIPETMKYFCISEAVAFYLQKYIVYRKRKIFYGKATFDDLMDEITKHISEKYLLPLSDTHKQDIPRKLKKSKVEFTKAILYKTVNSDLSDLAKEQFDIIVLYSPGEVASLQANFPSIDYNEIRLAAFGPATAKAVKDANLRLDIKAPTPLIPSMTMAIEAYLQKFNKK